MNHLQLFILYEKSYRRGLSLAWSPKGSIFGGLYPMTSRSGASRFGSARPETTYMRAHARAGPQPSTTIHEFFYIVNVHYNQRAFLKEMS